MEFYRLYFRNYFILFILFIFTIIMISLLQSKSVATASESDYGLTDVPIGKSTEEPMGKFNIVPVTPKPSKKSLPQNDENKSVLKTQPPTNTPKKSGHDAKSKTLSSTQPPKTLSPSSTPKSANPVNIYLSDNFLHLNVGETCLLGISFISKNDAIKNSNNDSNMNDMHNKIDIKVIGCDKLKDNTSNGTDESESKSIGKNIKGNKKTIANEILSIDNNCITANKTGIAVIVFYLKNNPNIKTSCTVRVTKQ